MSPALNGPWSFEQLLDLLRLFQFDENDDLWWREREGPGSELYFLINCSDTFYWAAADCEEILPEDIPDLARAKADAEATGEIDAFYWTRLWAARKRGERPMNVWLKRRLEKEGAVGMLALFEAAGPERESTIWAP